MKRFLLFLLAVLMCLPACGKSEDNETEPSVSFGEGVSCEDIMWAAVNAAHFSEDKSLEGTDTFLSDKKNFDEYEMSLWADRLYQECEEYALLEDYAIFYIPIAYKTYEVAVLKGKSADDAAKLEKVLQRRKESLASGDKGFYDPNFESIIEKAVIYTDGNYAIMIITGDVEASKAAIEALKK